MFFSVHDEFLLRVQEFFCLMWQGTPKQAPDSDEVMTGGGAMIAVFKCATNFAVSVDSHEGGM